MIPAPRATLNLESPCLPNSSVSDSDFGVETSYPYRVLLHSPVHSLKQDGLPLPSPTFGVLKMPFVCLFRVFFRVSLCSPGYSGTQCEDQVGFIFIL